MRSALHYSAIVQQRALVTLLITTLLLSLCFCWCLIEHVWFLDRGSLADA